MYQRTYKKMQIAIQKTVLIAVLIGIILVVLSEVCKWIAP